MKERVVTLASLAEGQAENLFQKHLAAALENIHDVRLAWKPKRRLTLTLELSTKADRKAVRVAIACKTKLVEPPAIETELKLGKEKGKIVARTGELFTPAGETSH